MIKKAAILFTAIFSLIFFSATASFSADENYIKSEQARLAPYLSKTDLSELVHYSDYNIYYDEKLLYNPTAKQLIEKINAAQEHAKQSNVAVSYYEYRNILKTMTPNDFYYMFLAYRLSETGFFSLAEKAMSNVKDREIWEHHISSIKKYEVPILSLKTPEEVFFAELMADIIYNNMTDESLKRIDKADKALVNSDYASYIRAKAYFAEKKHKKALNEINRAISKNENKADYIKFKAEIQNDIGNQKDALKTLKKINEREIILAETHKDIDIIKYYALSNSSKKESESKYYLAYYFYLNKDYQRAINELNGLMLKGENKQAPELLGYLYILTGKMQEAQKLYEKCLLKNTKAAFAHKGLGDIFLYQKNYEKALDEYKLAYKYNKKDIETLVALTATNYIIKDEKETAKYLKKAQKKDPKNFKVLYLTSQIAKDPKTVKESIKYNPFYPEGWLDLAQNSLQNNDLKNAEQYINAAAFITKRSPRYFYYKSILNTKKGNIETAQTDIERAAALAVEKGKVPHEQI